MTPNDIEILIHCHVCPAPHPRLNAPAVQGAINMLLANQLIEQDGDKQFNRWRTTARGAAHIAQLCAIPFPDQAWIDVCGNVIPGGVCSNYVIDQK